MQSQKRIWRVNLEGEDLDCLRKIIEERPLTPSRSRRAELWVSMDFSRLAGHALLVAFLYQFCAPIAFAGCRRDAQVWYTRRRLVLPAHHSYRDEKKSERTVDAIVRAWAVEPGALL